jgi:protein phosphatase
MSHSHNPPPAAAGLRWSGWTDRGLFRPNNEDAFLGVCFDAREIHHLGKFGQSPSRSMDFAFAVSDGMGGAKAGEHASRITTEKIAYLLPRSFGQSAAGLETGFTEVLEELFDQIHRALALLGGSYQECAGMEATLSLCWITPGWLYFGHIGDSRIYYLPARENAVKQLSHDDTHVGWLLRQG